MEGDRKLCEASFIRALIPIMRAPPSCPHHLLEGPPLNTIILKIRESTSFCLYGSYELLVLSLTAEGIMVGGLDLYVASLSLSSSSLRRDNSP